MFAASKPLASLSSGLLARKGQARPAMRPQGFASLAGMAAPLEDLGWNDMGQAEAAPAPVVAPEAAQPEPRPEPRPEPQPAPVIPVSEAVLAPIEPVSPPPVLAEREALREEIEGAPAAIEAPRVERPVSVATATRLARESAQQTRKSGKAAFTLRLDAERHLRLRLASALTGRSAQQLVTGAVDVLIAEMPEVEMLVAQLPALKKSSR
ncbi:hypothetical protein [Sphingomonas aerophila]|jgi:hypothetical protein|uniref:Putative HicB family RNase H-like nuclease n=1 Tax=Sphingomonas aerophila TaxID=1344948 RepID=A0A7W9BE28_9SPHN|nr:hypothetical protein [Sphingomonas aerophila]MBB5715488.1 putative HicB family RNase H-like nuclease [Sphingomonas aerophila]